MDERTQEVGFAKPVGIVDRGGVQPTRMGGVQLEQTG